MRHNGVGNLLARDVEFEDEVLVRNRRLVFQPHDGAVIIHVGDVDFVERGLQPVDGDACVEFDLDRDVVARARAFWSDLRGDARGVRNLVRVRRPSASLLAGRLARDVARAYDHRKNEFVRPVLILQEFDVTDSDFHPGAGGDVGDRLSEDVGALLVEQAGGLAGFARGFVNRLRLFAALDFAFDRAIADDHRYVVNGRRLWRREDINGFDLFIRGIAKLLCDGDVDDRTAA